MSRPAEFANAHAADEAPKSARPASSTRAAEAVAETAHREDQRRKDERVRRAEPWRRARGAARRILSRRPGASRAWNESPGLGTDESSFGGRGDHEGAQAAGGAVGMMDFSKP